MSLDDLTKRPPLGKGQPIRRGKARPTQSSAMARFPSSPGERAPRPESFAPQRRAKNIRPIWPLLIFLVILVLMIRGCTMSTHNDSSGPAPQVGHVSSLQGAAATR